MEECYTLLGISPTATTEEIEKAYLDKKREFTPSRFDQNSEEWQQASSMLKELDRAYNDAIMATFAPVKAFSPASKQISVQTKAPAPIQAPAQTAVHSALGKFTEGSEAAEGLDDLVDEVPVSFTDEQLLRMDAEQLRGSYDHFQQESVLLTWGIKNKLSRRYVMIYAAFVVLGLFITILGGPSSHAVMSTSQSVFSDLSATQAEHSAELLHSIASAHSHLNIDPASAQQITEAAEQLRGTAQQSRQAAEQTRPAAPPTMSVALLMVFLTTGYYFLCALPAPVIIRFFIMGEATSGRIFYIFSVLSASMLHFLTARLLGPWAGSTLTLSFVAILLCTATITYEES